MTVPRDVKVKRRQAIHTVKRVPTSARVKGAMIQAVCRDLEQVRGYLRTARVSIILGVRELNEIDRSAYERAASKAVRMARYYLKSARQVNTGTLGPAWSGWIQ